MKKILCFWRFESCTKCNFLVVQIHSVLVVFYLVFASLLIRCAKIDYEQSETFRFTIDLQKLRFCLCFHTLLLVICTIVNLVE